MRQQPPTPPPPHLHCDVERGRVLDALPQLPVAFKRPKPSLGGGIDSHDAVQAQRGAALLGGFGQVGRRLEAHGAGGGEADEEEGQVGGTVVLLELRHCGHYLRHRGGPTGSWTEMDGHPRTLAP
jgi:hypothetical protein